MRRETHAQRIVDLLRYRPRLDDDEIAKAYIHDRTSLDPQAVSYDALAASRNPGNSGNSCG